MSAVFIDDGYTLTRHFPAVPGVYPALEIVYRPALSRERYSYSTKLATKNAEAIEAHEIDLVRRFCVSINGEQPAADKLKRINPAVQSLLVELILVYAPADPDGTDEGKG